MTPFSVETRTLYLHAPIKYDSGERVYCFEIPAGQGQRIDPAPDLWLGGEVSSPPAEQTAAGAIAIPAGCYLFAQRRLDDDAFPDGGAAPLRGMLICMGIEIQKDGLWERRRLENRVYLRLLREDGAAVVQVIRPLAAVPS